MEFHFHCQSLALVFCSWRINAKLLCSRKIFLKIDDWLKLVFLVLVGSVWLGQSISFALVSVTYKFSLNASWVQVLIVAMLCLLEK